MQIKIQRVVKFNKIFMGTETNLKKPSPKRAVFDLSHYGKLHSLVQAGLLMKVNDRTLIVMSPYPSVFYAFWFADRLF